jgi:hypothetical protein
MRKLDPPSAHEHDMRLEAPVAKARKTAAPKLPRIPLPRQTGHRHEDETKKSWRDRKHKKLKIDE